MAEYKWPAGAGGGTGTVSGPISSVDGQAVVFDGTDGDTIKAFLGTGVVKSNAGVLSAGTVSDSELAAGINANKLADGSVSDAEFQHLNGVTSGIQAQIDANSAALSNLSWKDAVLCATTADITLSGLQIIDGSGNSAGVRVLVKNQTAQGDNGIYIMNAGAWTRAPDADTFAECQIGSVVFVKSGSTNFLRAFAQQNTLASFATNQVWGTVFGYGTSASLIADGTISNTEFQHLNGVSSNLQTQITDRALASSVSNVDNTSDANKPVSTAQQTALDLKANLASPTFTGTVTLPNSTVTSAMIADGTIVDADISASAAIAGSKIAAATGTTAGTIPAYETVVHTGTFRVTSQVGADISSSSYTLTATRIGNVVTVRITGASGLSGNSSASQMFASNLLPSTYRPDTVICGAQTYYGSGTATFHIRIQSGGAVDVQMLSSGNVSTTIPNSTTIFALCATYTLT